jgi:DNA-binding beta-propeller fold protein YncE
MIYNRYIFSAAMLYIIAIGFFSSCKKTGSPGSGTPPSSAITIQSVSPVTGPGLTQVTITGTGFQSITTQDSIFFNGHYAPIQSSTDTTISLQVPVRAGTGNIFLKQNTDTITGPLFTYIYTTTQIIFAGNNDINGIDGQGKAASFFYPEGLAMDANGNLFVSQAASGVIRTITPGGLVQSLPTAFIPPVNLNHGAMGINIEQIMGIALDNSTGRLWVADPGDNSVSYFNSTGSINVTSLLDSTQDKTTAITPFQLPSGVTAANGQVYISDVISNNIQIIKSGKQTFSVINNGKNQNLFNQPCGLALDAFQNLYITNAGADNILKMTGSGDVTVLAGSGSKGNADGQGLSASFYGPQGIAIDGFNMIYIADSYNQRIRLINQAGLVTTLPLQYQLSYPLGLAVTPDGSTLYIADVVSSVIYKISIQ